MSGLIHQFITNSAQQNPTATALIHKNTEYSYAALQSAVTSTADGLIQLGLAPSERVAVYLPKQPETVFGLFGTAQAGGVFVPVNPLLKPHQVAYILKDCNVRVLITSADRLRLLAGTLTKCHDLRTVIIVGQQQTELPDISNIIILNWETAFSKSSDSATQAHRRIDTDMAAAIWLLGLKVWRNIWRIVRMIGYSPFCHSALTMASAK